MASWWYVPDLSTVIKGAVRITPRLVVAGLAGYYILGFAYAHGWMAAIDQLAMRILLDYGFGYLSIGALMPTIQWYAAWGVRVTAALVAGIAYDITERIVLYVIKTCTSPFYKEQVNN